MIFQCNRCLKFFSYKTNYLNHLRRKIPCKENIQKNIDQIVSTKIESESNVSICFRNGNKLTYLETNGNKMETKNQCLICNKIYQNRSGLFKHKKSKHPNYETELSKINNKSNISSGKSEFDKFKELFIQDSSLKDKRIENLMQIINEKNTLIEDMVKTSKNKTINNTNNTTNNNTTNNNNGIINNVTIVGFGKEDYGLLNSEEIHKILCDINNDPLTTSIEMIHFNQRLPQYQNIKLKDIKSKYIDIHNGSFWQKQSKSNIIDETLDNHMYNIKSLKEEFPNKAKIKKSVSRLINNYDLHYDLETEDKKSLTNKKLVKNIGTEKEKICLAIINNGNNLTPILTNNEIMDV